MSAPKKMPHLKLAHYTEINTSDDPNIIKKRTYAFTLDLFFIASINKALMFTYVNFLETFFYQLSVNSQININNQLSNLNGLSTMFVFWGYFLLSYYMGEGKTPAKMLFGLKVHSPHSADNHLSFKESFLRTSAYFLCCFFGMFLLAIPFFRRDKKGLPDWFSHTHVVTDDEINVVHHLEDHGMQEVKKWTNDIRFPEDPISRRISEDQKKKSIFKSAA